MQSGEQAPEPEPAAVREAAAPPVVVAPEPTALVGDEAAEAAAGEAPRCRWLGPACSA